MNDDGAIIGGTKVWTETELEISIIFEVPKEKNPRDDEKSANDNSLGTSTPTNDITNNDLAQEDKSSGAVERNTD